MLFPTLFYPAKAQKINIDAFHPAEMPVGHYTKEIRAIDNQQLLKIVEAFKAASTNPNQSINLSLDQCISLAFANNPSLKSQIESLKSTRDTFIARSRSWNPTALIRGSSNGNNENRNSVNQVNSLNSKSPSLSRTNSTSSRNSYPQSITGELSWKFLDFSRQPTIDAAASAYSAQRYAFYNASRTLVFQIQETYYQLIAQQELIKSFETIAESLKSTVLFTDSRFEAGLAHLGDVGQVHAQYYSTLSDLTSYIERYYQLSSQLARLVSLPGEPLILAEGENQFAGEWIFGLEESIDLAQLNNDRVLSSLELSKRYNFEGIAERNRTLPSFSLSSTANLSSTSSDSYAFNTTSVSGSSNSSSDSRETSNSFSFGSNTSYDVSAGIGFTWNFYQGGVNNATASALFSRSKSEEFNVEDIRDQLIENVRASINALRSNRIRFMTSDAAVESAKISYIASIARLNAGFSDVTTINQLVRLYQNSIQAEIIAIQDYNIRLATLYRDTAIWPQEAEGLAVELLEATGLTR
ncbi:TolC family protein [Synechococcus sp. UW179A]|uniref:TolC family protein n=1 Tax=Synechococcus sp. UW179A TaxID=2575510 RepID=UPI001482076D|nr:TolC family protein [Synechococcus sp. UW179A]